MATGLRLVIPWRAAHGVSVEFSFDILSFYDILWVMMVLQYRGDGRKDGRRAGHPSNLEGRCSWCIVVKHFCGRNAGCGGLGSGQVDSTGVNSSQNPIDTAIIPIRMCAKTFYDSNSRN
jgi:hypothetical protein